MKRRRPRVDEIEEEFSELDALTLQELQALKSAASSARPKAKRAKNNNVIFKEKWAKTASDSVDWESDETSEAVDEERDRLNANMTFEDISPGSERSELFEPEEQEFIQRTVDWLTPRTNKDMIISRIWTLLTESETESFYTPEDAQEEVSSPSTDIDEEGDERGDSET